MRDKLLRGSETLVLGETFAPFRGIARGRIVSYFSSRDTESPTIPPSRDDVFELTRI